MDNSSFLTRFRVRNNAQEPFVGIPNGPFRIRPERESPLVYLTNLKDKGGWHLVDEDIVDEVDLPNLWQAKLYEGVTESGRPFLLPLTLTGNPNSEGWEKSLQTGIAKGKQGWVSRETDKQLKRFKIYLEQGVMHEPDWWDGSFEELAEVAFGNRIIDAKYLNRRKRTAWDDVEES